MRKPEGFLEFLRGHRAVWDLLKDRAELIERTAAEYDAARRSMQREFGLY